MWVGLGGGGVIGFCSYFRVLFVRLLVSGVVELVFRGAIEIGLNIRVFL